MSLGSLKEVGKELRYIVKCLHPSNGGLIFKKYKKEEDQTLFQTNEEFWDFIFIYLLYDRKYQKIIKWVGS